MRSTTIMNICLTLGAVWISMGVSAVYFAQSNELQIIALEATIGSYFNDTDRQVFKDAKITNDETRTLGKVFLVGGTIVLMVGIYFAFKEILQKSKI